MNDIFTIANTHFEKFKQDGFNSVQEWLCTEQGKKSIELKKISSNVDISLLLEENYNKYIISMKNGISLMVDILTSCGVLHRIYDIDSYEESPGGIICKWTIENKEYICGIFANIDSEPYLKVAYIHGDIIMDTIPVYNLQTPLPKWFVNGLKYSYC